MTALRSKVISSLRWQAAAKLGSQIISWSVTIYVMRLLSPADYGLMAMAMVLVGFTGLIAEMGMGSALVQSQQVDLGQQRSVFGLSLLVNGTLYLLLAASAPLAVAVFNEPRLLALTLVMGLQLPLAALTVVPESMARRELRFKALGIIELLTQSGTVLTTLIAAVMGMGVWALVAGQLAQTLIKCLLMLMYFGTVAPTFGLSGQRRLVMFGGALTVNRVIWFLYSQADVFVAGRLLGPQLLGIYSAAVNLANMPMQKIMAISNQVAFSALSKLQADPKALAEGVLSSLRLVATIAVGLLWGLAATAPVLIPLLLGDKWLQAVLPLQLVAITVPLRILGSTLSTATIAAGHVSMDLRNNIAGLLLLAPSFMLGAHLGGINGLALAWLAMFPVFFLVVVKRTSGALGLRMRTVLGQLGRPALAGASMVATVLGVEKLFDHLSQPLLLALIIAAGATAFVVSLAVIDRATLRDMLHFVRAPSARPATGAEAKQNVREV